MTVVDLAAMSIAEKLKLMEKLWDSLCAQSGSDMTSLAWHREVLDERLRRLANGEESAAPWAEAKERIRIRVQGR